MYIKLLSKLKILIFVLFFLMQTNQSFAVQTKKYTTKDLIIDTNDSIQKRSFETDFQEKYNSADFDYNEKPKEKSGWQKFLEWLARILRNSETTNSEPSNNFFGYLFYFVCGLIVLFVIIFIVKNIVNNEGSWFFGRNSNKNIVDSIDIETDIKNVDFRSLIDKTIASKNYRLAIRYYYLWVLKKMSDNEIIVWDIEKTNSDYLYEIKNETTKNEFSYLSYIYNYIWYGAFEIDADAFLKAKDTFEKSINKL